METKNYIGGEWIIPKAGRLNAVSPSSINETIGTVNLSSKEDALQAVEAAKYARKKWGNLTPGARGEFLLRAALILEKRANDIARIASLEMGKPITEMKGEVNRGVNLLRYYGAEGVRAVGTVIPASQSNVLQYTKRVPLGVVGIITPWNFPVAIPIWKIAPALICGNTIVWKPAENAYFSATAVAEVFAEAGLPEGVLNLVVGKGSVAGQALIEEGELDALSFTGSTATGLKLAQQAARRNIKYQTEMGGKNAAIVLEDADLDLAVNAIVSGGFSSAGQKCTATSRVIVASKVYDQFVSRLQTAVENLYVGSSLDEKSYLGPVASAVQYDTVSSFVSLAKEEANVLAEASLQVDQSTGYYIKPLVVDGVSKDHKLVQDEIFGPVMALLPVDSFEEAVLACNETVYGLSASIFTNNLKQAHQFLDEAEAGMVRVNLETAGVEYQAPFGGMKQSSSHSREQGQAALDFYSQIKTSAIYYG